jgi:acyl-coenzyme A synthetase/AMP-(fatty) acid ligase
MAPQAWSLLRNPITIMYLGKSISCFHSLTAAAIRKEVSSIVPAYLVPARVDVLDRLPKTITAKQICLKTRYC